MEFQSNQTNAGLMPARGRHRLGCIHRKEYIPPSGRQECLIPVVHCGTLPEFLPAVQVLKAKLLTYFPATQVKVQHSDPNDLKHSFFHQSELGNEGRTVKLVASAERSSFRQYSKSTKHHLPAFAVVQNAEKAAQSSSCLKQNRQ